MLPERNTKIGIADLLDRALDKGVVIAADVIISLADVPLIGLNIRAALASVETMLDYGLMVDWDEAQKAVKKEEKLEVRQETIQIQTKRNFNKNAN